MCVFVHACVRACVCVTISECVCCDFVCVWVGVRRGYVCMCVCLDELRCRVIVSLGMCVSVCVTYACVLFL